MAPPTAMPPGNHLILYDGTCGLCHRFVQFVIARDPDGRFHFAALQDDSVAAILRRYGKDATALDTSYIVVAWKTGEETLLAKARGSLFVLGALGWPWKVMTALRVLPTAWLDWGYDRIARNRQRLFGEREGCPVMDPKLRQRFPNLRDDPAGRAGRP